jgi:hypothetical protein
MDAEQKAAAWQLLEVSLSSKGLEQTRAYHAYRADACLNSMASRSDTAKKNITSP